MRLMSFNSFVYSVFIKIVLKQLFEKEDAIACRPITNCGINLGKAIQASYICLTTTSMISIITTATDERRNAAGHKQGFYHKLYLSYLTQLQAIAHRVFAYIHTR